MPLLLLLIGVPLIEILLFIEIGGAIGVWATILLVLVTAATGAAMLRAQGVAAIRRLQSELETGGDPSPLIVHGAMLLFAGALLLTPGFLTDAVGFALLIPKAREKIIAWAKPHVMRRVVTAATRRGPQVGPQGGRGGFDAPGDQPIDADYTVVDEDKESRR